MTKNEEDIRRELQNEIVKELIDAAKKQNSSVLVYLSDIDDVGAFYLEKTKYLKSLLKNGVITKFKELEKMDGPEEWDDLEIESDPESWMEYKNNFSPEKRLYAEISFDPQKIKEVEEKGMFGGKTKSFQDIPLFKEKESGIYIGKVCIRIPIGTAMFCFCKTMFGIPIGNFISEEALLEEIERAGTKETVRTVYDAMNRVNRIIRKETGIEKLFERKNNNFRIKKELFE